MDEQLTALAKEIQDLRDRQLQDRHEAIMRDDAIFRRIGMHEDRMDFHAEALKKTISAVGECADTITKLGQRLDGLVQKIDLLVARMDKTDERWSQLIEQLTREHRNGGKKR
jgi:hypothetical protein